MTQGTIDVFTNEKFSKPPKKDYCTNRTDAFHIDETWNLDILYLKDHGPEKNRGCRYVLVFFRDSFEIWTDYSFKE